MENIKNELIEAGYDFAVAIATKAEVEANAACGQLALIKEWNNPNSSELEKRNENEIRN